MDNITKKKIICLGISLAAAFFITGSVMRGKALEYKMEETQKSLAEEVFRFHVLANSNSEADQSLKLKVRDTILAYMEAEVPEDADLKETKSWAKAHLEEMEEIAEAVIHREGFWYETNAEVEMVKFPGKSYGDITFPAGEYEALRIVIGEGEGENWWCVLYPNLCFVNSVKAVVPEEGKAKLSEALSDEEYEMVTMGTKFKIKWYFFGCN